jgi:two-component system NtrC family sensor kinase
MDSLRHWFASSFRIKVLVPAVACMVAVMAITAVVVNSRITTHFESEARNSLSAANDVFNVWETIHSRELQQRFRSLPDAPENRGAFHTLVLAENTNDMSAAVQTVRDRLTKLITEQGVDLALFVNDRGELVTGATHDPLVTESALQGAAASEVAAALQGNDSVVVGVSQIGDRLYNLVSIRAYDTEHVQMIGVLTLGMEIDQRVAQQLHDLTGCEVALVAGGNIVGSKTFPSGAKDELVAWFRQLPPKTQSGEGAFVAEKNVLSGVHYFYAGGHFSKPRSNDNLGYLLLNAYEGQAGELQKTQMLLLLVNLAAIFSGSIVVWFFVRRATRPLHELRVSAEAVGRGDFSQRVVVRSKDECGQLAGVFNRMTGNLQQSRVQLEKTVESLKTTQAQLVQSEKLSAVGEFVAGVAHELNNPLATVMGLSELLQDSKADPQQKRYLDMIHKSSLRCQKIVQSLLSFARRHQPERKPISVNQLIETVLEIVAYQLRTSNIKVNLQLDPNLPLVEGDEHQLQQVLLNIVNNARQAMGQERTDSWIKIVTEVAGPNIRILLHDNGPGIPPENLPRIFDPFFTTKEVGKGTGLGLSICYGIIKEHGGSITPLNRGGEGATFIIELPVLHGTNGAHVSSQPTSHETDHAREGKGKRVLVVDDEEGLLQMMSEELNRRGYEVVTATGGETGLRQLQQNHFDAMICDWKMPGMSGRQVYEKLRTTRPDFCRRVIFVTGDVINDLMQKFLEQEKRPCLAKPFALAELRRVIKAVVAT